MDGEVTTYEVTINSEPTFDTGLRGARTNPKSIQLSLNGTEHDMSLDTFNLMPHQSAEYPYEPPQTRGGYYWWDGLYFKDNYQVPYPHPDKNTYQFGAFQDWYKIGDDLIHYQFEHVLSQTIVIGGVTLGGAIIGGAIGLCGGPVTGFIGMVVGGAIGLVWSYFTHHIYLDEDDCLWYWTDRSIIGWMDGWSPYLNVLWDVDQAYVINMVMGQWTGYGYCRLGRQNAI